MLLMYQHCLSSNYRKHYLLLKPAQLRALTAASSARLACCPQHALVRVRRLWREHQEGLLHTGRLHVQQSVSSKFIQGHA